MPKSEYTKGPWAQGRILDTPQTRKWPTPMRLSVEHDEARRIFSAFTSLDQGKGRIQICQIQEDVPGWVANAHLIAAAPELLEAIISLRSFMWEEGYSDQSAPMAQADAAIRKAGAR